MNREDLERELREEMLKTEPVDPLARALEVVGQKRRFTKQDLRDQLGADAPTDLLRQFQQRLKQGYLGVDEAGIYVTDLGWTWIHGGHRRVVE